ncbi:uncharacterized protein LOC142582612 isoform X4 [Dermacentor variabilis]|uniref:uncharacterized protein LOC142582612 isoform X4 n=1 Tax=Dermacentor variabilis TaxID=34621 RepID=UPI003F5C0C4C
MTETNELASVGKMAMSGNRSTCAALRCTPGYLHPPKMTVMHSHEVETLVTCAKAHADMPEKVLNHWNDQIAMFTGMSDAEVVLLVCKTSLDAGEALPEHKKTIDTIAAQCYEKATGQKTA